MVYLGMAAAGAIGALARYWVSQRMADWLGAAFPWGTLTANLAGCLLIGWFMELVRITAWISPEMRLIAGTGFLGAFTTFSTFGFETLRAIEAGDWRGAGLNIGANLLGGLALVAAGSLLARWMVAGRHA
jgi:CrcB protein